MQLFQLTNIDKKIPFSEKSFFEKFQTQRELVDGYEWVFENSLEAHNSLDVIPEVSNV